jgi:hypothetical protein
LGRAFAEQGLETILGSAEPHTADGFVLDGIASVDGRHKVMVLLPAERLDTWGDIAKFDGRVDISVRRLQGTWSVESVWQILAADAAVVIAGHRRTAQMAYMAPALERPVVAIPSFGGGAREQWPMLQPLLPEPRATR